VSFAMVLQDLDVAANGADGVLRWLARNIPAKGVRFPRATFLKGQWSALREWAAGSISDRALPRVPGTIPTSSSSTR